MMLSVARQKASTKYYFHHSSPVLIRPAGILLNDQASPPDDVLKNITYMTLPLRYTSDLKTSFGQRTLTLDD